MSNVKKPTPITSWYDEVDQTEHQMVTTEQSDYYANERVREVLEEAAKQPREYAMFLDRSGWGNRFPDELTAIFNATDNMAARIRALIPKQ